KRVHIRQAANEVAVALSPILETASKSAGFNPASWIPDESERDHIREAMRLAQTHFKLEDAQFLLVNPLDKTLASMKESGRFDAPLKPEDLHTRYSQVANQSVGRLDCTEVPRTNSQL